MHLTNADIAGHTDFSGTGEVAWGDTVITPDDGGSILGKVKKDYLWDFSDDPPYSETLYAVWSEPVTVTFDLRKTGSTLHTWKGPATTAEDGFNVFFRETATSRYITYKMAAGDLIPRPDDPTAAVSGWYFLAWLISNSSTQNYPNTTKDPSDNTIISYTYDFSRPVTENLTLLTSWTKNQPQHYTFTVENRIENAPAGEEFEYTIAVTDELGYGKPVVNGTNTIAEPNKKWGEVTTTLKNNEQYTVDITVLKMTNGWTAYSIQIDVTDSTGTLIKSGQVFYFDGNSKKNYTSDFIYTLQITQEEKAKFETTVEVDTEDDIQYSTDDVSCFTFISKENTSTGNSDCVSTFGGEPMNGFTAGEENSATIIFTNKKEIVVAPTAYTSRHLPYLLMLAAGLILMLLSGTALIRGKRSKKEEEETCSVKNG